MVKREEKALRELMVKWNKPNAMAYSSNPEFEDGVDIGRENCADELEWLIDFLLKINLDKP